MIYDCFMFFAEHEVLDIRLHELSDVVDRFVLIEAGVTHSKRPKPFYFEENKHLFAEFLDRIVHIKLNCLPDTPDNWDAEKFQRNCLSAALVGCKADDLVIISDVDEIPRASEVAKYNPADGVRSFDHTLYNYFLNCRSKYFWHGARILPYGELIKWPSASAVRLHQWPAISNGGWHFSFLGDVEKIQQKITAFAHQEFNTPAFNNPANLQRCISMAQDPFGREFIRFELVPLDDSFPRYVLQNVEKFSHLIKYIGDRPGRF